MAVVGPRTIVLRTGQNKQLLVTSSTTSVAGMGQYGQDGTIVNNIHEIGRKRKRLTHLSPEERLNRRKLKNRVAAQTARDRKKERMDELESALVELEAENRKLLNENGALRHRTDNLAVENVNLREKLGLPINDDVVIPDGKERVTESAALVVPQQKERVLALYYLMTHYLALCYTMNLMCSVGFCSKLPRANKRSAMMKQKLTQRRRAYRHRSMVWQRTPHLKWWGPRQRNWNPSMNSSISITFTTRWKSKNSLSQFSPHKTNSNLQNKLSRK